MKKFFKKILEFITQDWQTIFILTMTALSMIACIVFSISLYKPVSNNALQSAQDMWNKGVNNVSYESISIISKSQSIEEFVDISSIYDKGFENIDTSKINVNIILDNRTCLSQEGDVVTISHPGLFGLCEESFKIDFSSEQAVTKKTIIDFIGGIVLTIFITLGIGFMMLLLSIMLTAPIENIIFKFKKLKSSKKKE